MYDNEYAHESYQQETLIPGRFQAPPTSVAHLADRVEASGAKIEETLAKLNFTIGVLFFLAAWLVIIAGAMSLISSFLTLSLLGMFRASFLFVFGLLQMTLDVPGTPRWAAKWRTLVFKQFKFLTRITGKALWNIFLSSMILVCLWPDTNRRGAGLGILLTLAFSFVVGVVGFISLFVGLRKTLHLEKVRKQILSHYRGNATEVFRKYAITDPAHGIQFDEFNRMCSDYSQGRLTWSVSDLALIFNALDEHQKGAINEREFCEWCASSMTYL